MYPDDRKYTRTHEWVKLEGTSAKMGVTGYAEEQLGDIVFVELPEIGREVKKGETLAVVESVKAVTDCYAPVSGKVIHVNDFLLDEPGKINQDAHGEGWIAVIEASDPAEMNDHMNAAAYVEFLKEVGDH